MRRDLSFLVLAGLVGAASACIIVTDDGNDTGGDTENNTSGNNTTEVAETGATAAETGSTAAADDTTRGEATAASDDTAGAAACGWGPTGDETIPEGYVCGGEGEDPDGNFALSCPEGVELTEGGDCGGIEGQGCCDAAGNVWFCGDAGRGPVLALITC